MGIGPVQYMVVAFPGNQFKGEIAPALEDLVRSGTIRIIDLAFIVKAADGSMTGMELEVGYMPLILRDCANADVRPGGRGYLDASARIRKLQVPAGGAPSRAQGDVHALGNPHYLMDPANAVILSAIRFWTFSARRRW